jgi:hypothetical protein
VSEEIAGDGVMQCPLALLVQVRLREGEASGSEKVK